MVVEPASPVALGNARDLYVRGSALAAPPAAARIHTKIRAYVRDDKQEGQHRDRTRNEEERKRQAEKLQARVRESRLNDEDDRGRGR